MVWIGLYVAVAVLVALALFAVAELRRSPEVPAPRCPAVCAIAAGLLWPALLVGAAEWGLIVMLRAHLTRTASGGRAPRRIPQPVGV